MGCGVCPLHIPTLASKVYGPLSLEPKGENAAQWFKGETWARITALHQKRPWWPSGPTADVTNVIQKG